MDTPIRPLVEPRLDERTEGLLNQDPIRLLKRRKNRLQDFVSAIGKEPIPTVVSQALRSVTK